MLATLPWHMHMHGLVAGAGRGCKLLGNPRVVWQGGAGGGPLRLGKRMCMRGYWSTPRPPLKFLLHRYVAEDTPNVQYINAHQVIQNLREEAKASGGQGPRVMVVGPTDTGKSSVCKMLLNWGVRAGAQPTYVDLDVGGCSRGVVGAVACWVWAVACTAGPGCAQAQPLAHHTHAEAAPRIASGVMCGAADPSREHHATPAHMHTPMSQLQSCALPTAGQGSITAPGSLAAAPIETPIDVEEGFSSQVGAGA